jgi:hypothetical protein
MMTNRGSSRLQVRNPEIDRFARSARINLNGFELLSPYFFSLVQNNEEASCLREIARANAHFGGAVVRIFDAPAIVGSRKNNYQATFDSQIEFSEGESRKYKRNFPIVIDPATEYLYYRKHMLKWRTLASLPESLRKYLARCRADLKYKKQEQKKLRKQHWQLWNEQIADHPDLEHKLIGYFFDTELSYESATLLPPVPVVDSELDLDTTFEMNRLAVLDATGKNAEQVNYFIVQPSMIESEHIRSKLVDFVAESPVRLNVFKFKYVSLRGAGPGLLDGFAELYERLAQVREKQPQKAFMILENGEQVFPSAAVCFDFVSSSMTGFDFDRGGKSEGKGGLWDYRKKVNIKIDAIERAYKNNGNKPSCNHSPCQSVSPVTSSLAVWYRIRRQHYVLTMDDFMADLARYVREANIEQARRDLINSNLSLLRELVPTNWGQPAMPVPP